MKNVSITVENGVITDISNSEITRILWEGQEYLYHDCEILPAYTDSHCHVWGLGMINSGLDVSGCSSAEETALKAYSNRFMRDNWFVGRGWNNELWGEGNLPDKSILDKLFPDNPVSLTRIDGHAIWCNSKALEISGINENTSNPNGGIIQKDSNGSPTGILIDNAMYLAEKNIPEFSQSQLSDFIIKGLGLVKKSGITCVHDMDLNIRHLDCYRKLAHENLLKTKVFAFFGNQNGEAEKLDLEPMQIGNFKLQGIKLYADGALGSYGAALLDDYSDKPNEKGILMLSSEDIFKHCLFAHSKGFDVAVHAIGDRAVREVLDGFELFRNAVSESSINLRIEHSQIVNPDDISRYKELNVIASVQPIHFVSDSNMAKKRLGIERLIESGYPWEKFLNNNVMMIAGSDFPIESYDVAAGIEAFTQRANQLGAKEIFRECVEFSSAVECYTVKPYLALGIHNYGEICVGHKCDLIIMDSSKKIIDVLNNNHI